MKQPMVFLYSFTIKTIRSFCSTISGKRLRKRLPVKYQKLKRNGMTGYQERGDLMATWNDYKQHVRQTNPELAKDVDEVEALSQIVGAMIEQRHQMDLSQRDLASLCGLPHSSIARIESGKSTPNLSTLLKIFHQLGLSFTVHYLQRT